MADKNARSGKPTPWVTLFLAVFLGGPATCCGGCLLLNLASPRPTAAPARPVDREEIARIIARKDQAAAAQEAAEKAEFERDPWSDAVRALGLLDDVGFTDAGSVHGLNLWRKYWPSVGKQTLVYVVSGPNGPAVQHANLDHINLVMGLEQKATPESDRQFGAAVRQLMKRLCPTGEGKITTAAAGRKEASFLSGECVALLTFDGGRPSFELNRPTR